MATIAVCSEPLLPEPRRSRSFPAATAATAASGSEYRPTITPMSSASVTMTPLKPSRSRRSPVTTGRAKSAGLHVGSSPGTYSAVVITASAPAAIPAEKLLATRESSGETGGQSHFLFEDEAPQLGSHLRSGEADGDQLTYGHVDGEGLEAEHANRLRPLLENHVGLADESLCQRQSVSRRR